MPLQNVISMLKVRMIIIHAVSVVLRIYIIKFNVPVGWYVGWLVGLSGFQAPTGRRIRTVYMSKEPSQPQNEPRRGYFQIQPHPEGIKGGRSSP